MKTADQIATVHTIHGIRVRVAVYQGRMTEDARGHCIGKVVNLCRAMPEAKFVEAMDGMVSSLQGNTASSKFLKWLDAELAKGCHDLSWGAPVASVDPIEESAA